MVLGRVGADHHDDVGILHLVEGGRHRRGADAFQQRRDRRGMAEPRAVIDIVGAEAGADQLLEQIGLFVRAFRRTEAGETLRALLLADLQEALRGLVERLVPGRFAEMRPRIGRIDEFVRDFRHALLADHRLGDALRIVHVVEAEAALHAQPVLVRRTVLAGDVEQLVVLDIVGELAADAAIGADRIRPACRHIRCGRCPGSTSEDGISAPVGQACTHSPQATQVDCCPSDRRNRTRSFRDGRGRPCRSRR